jgi:diguanylate cyclase (GGDEF)-like protein
VSTTRAMNLVAGSECGHDHLVEFYESEDFLVDTVCDFFAPALRDGDAIIVVATAAHRHQFAAALDDAGIDVSAATKEGRFLAFDARDLLARFMVDGQPDVVLFRRTIGAVMDRASAAGRQIRVYGEMVALLWDDGDVASALALEDLWNDLAGIRTFVLLCAYPMRAFDDEASAAAFKRICEQHTAVIPSESYSLLSDPDEQSRLVARLQQETSALRSEVLRMRNQLDLLAELAYVDSLTMLGNRRAFDLRLTWEWTLTQCREADSFVVVIGLHGLVALAERCGLAAGERVLRQFAEVLRAVAGPPDIVARIGWDQFGVLMIGCDASAACNFEVRLRQVLSEGAWLELAQIDARVDHASLQECSSPATVLDLAKSR